MPGTMIAAHCERYGPPEVVSLRQIPRPVPEPDSLLVRVRATTVTTADWRQRAGAFPGFAALPARLALGLRGPRAKVLGSEFAGEVVSCGASVTRFRPGDAVFGFVSSGAHAEFLVVKETGVVATMPADLDFTEAAATPFGGQTALVFLRDIARLAAQERILIIGGSGGVGVFAVQIARSLGAEVTALASPANHALLRDLGAQHVADYDGFDYAGPGGYWDVIFDTVGATTYPTCRNALKPNGRFIPLEFDWPEIWHALVTRLRAGPRVLLAVSGDTAADLAVLRDMLASRALRPVIDSRFALSDIASAYSRVETRHKTGSVIVNPGGPDPA